MKENVLLSRLPKGIKKKIIKKENFYLDAALDIWKINWDEPDRYFKYCAMCLCTRCRKAEVVCGDCLLIANRCNSALGPNGIVGNCEFFERKGGESNGKS